MATPSGMFAQEAPINDNFAAATEITSLPNSYEVYLSAATIEDGEPVPSCVSGDYPAPFERTVWYRYTPAQETMLVMNVNWIGAYAIYEGDAFDNLNELDCRRVYYEDRRVFEFAAGRSYYFQFIDSYAYYGTFSLTEVKPPSNDDYEQALEIGGLPYQADYMLLAATMESGEPTPSCYHEYQAGQSIWYAYTPDLSKTLMATVGWNVIVALYTGDDLGQLHEVTCGMGMIGIAAKAGTRYLFQVVNTTYYGADTGQFMLDVAPPPGIYMYAGIEDPSIYDTVWFYMYYWDPLNSPATVVWDFGDGTSSSNEGSVEHKYAADGDYTVRVTVTTEDGRTNTATTLVEVRTYDVAIASMKSPPSAREGQTRTISVAVKNKSYGVKVNVYLLKSRTDGIWDWQWGNWEQVGVSSQTVPVRSGNRMTEFALNYTFTAADAAVGKVTFKVVAETEGWRDAFRFDNEMIASPVKVSYANVKASGAEEFDGGSVDGNRTYLPVIDVNP